MSRPLVVDASVAVKWFVPEADSDEAERLLRSDAVLHAPEFLRAEVANALSRQSRKGFFIVETGDAALRALSDAIQGWHALEGLVGPAFKLSIELVHPVYDCIYLALAARLEAVLVTADRRFIDRVENSPHRKWVKSLGDENVTS